MKLPIQLQNNQFRFVLIKKGTKCPYEEAWHTTNNYPFFNKKIELTENVGIVCGYGNLIVLDIDNIKYLDEFDKKCNTFSVKTGSGKRHYYFICREQFNQSYYVLANSTGELRCKNSQVLIPGSYHPNGNMYTVFCSSDIREINKEELKKLLNNLLTKDTSIRDTTRSGKEWADILGFIEAGYNFDDLDKEMIVLGHERWIQRGMEYRLNQYFSALKAKKLNKPKDL